MYEDPAFDFFAQDMRQFAKIQRQPHCRLCREAIWQDSAVRIDGAYYCDDCLRFCRIPLADPA
ncbi:MAG: hypothetical protein MSH10_05135 [Pygmaiobacter massiliensis]|nr:hypothetical protein [Pygmaiobacter massiliensis]